jgi:shikimate kinase
VALISLIGLPGSGKTTIGWNLAKRVGLPFYDSDQIIAQRLGCSIRDFFDREGEEKFRDLEQQTIAELVRSDAGVLSTGGGVVLRAANREMLTSHSDVVYLRATPEELFRRLRYDRDRPLLQVADPLGRLRELFGQRDPLYKETATFVVETHRPSHSKVLSILLMQLELAGKLPTQTHKPVVDSRLNVRAG